MRTTLVLDDTLLRRAKQQAARMGLSLSGLVERALRDALRETKVPPGPFHMPTYGSPGTALGHEPADFAAALLEEEAAALRGR